MATRSITLAQKLPWTEQPGRGLRVHGVSKNMTRLRDFTFTFHFLALEKACQPTAVFLARESQGQRSLVGCHLWGLTELDATEAT